MGIFREPWVLLIVAVLIILLFAGPKLPAMAKGLGQSMRIFRKEVKDMKAENSPAEPAAAAPAVTTSPAEPVATETTAPSTAATAQDETKQTPSA